MRRVLVAFMLFRTAETATWIALLVWAFARDGASAAATIAVAQLIPATLVAPLGSVLGDRMSRPKALRLGYLLQGATNLATAVGLFLDAPFWVVAALAAAAASMLTLTRPVHHALVPEIARTPDELTAGNTASTASEGVASFVGPALAGLLLSFTSAGWVFVLMGVFGLVAASITRGLRIIQLATIHEPRPYWSDAVEGVRILVGNPSVGILTVVVAAQAMLFGLLDILVVILALERLGTGPAGPGLITSALGVGAFVGAGLAVTLIGRRRMTPALRLGILATSVPVAAVAFSSSFPAALLLFAAIGAGAAFLNVAARTLLQRNMAPRVLARVFGIQESLLVGGLAVGAASAPPLVAWVGLQGTFIVAGLLLPTLGLLGWLRIRRLDLQPAPPGPAMELLRGIPMFAVLPQPQLESLAGALQPVTTVRSGEAVVTQGEPGDRYYVVVSGTVRVTRDGREVATLGPGQGFGEIALLRDVPRTATVRTVGDVQVVALAREPFLLAVTGSDVSFRTVSTVLDELLDHDDAEVVEPDDDADQGAPA
jgi:MFS family permease